eukprot:COSAG04_NODE_222_length_19676_cov_26.070991_7_plen_296_part_00
MWSNFPCVFLCRRSFRRRADLGWPELIIGFLGSPVASFVEAVSRLLVFLGQHDGRYEAAFAQVKQHCHPYMSQKIWRQLSRVPIRAKPEPPSDTCSSQSTKASLESKAGHHRSPLSNLRPCPCAPAGAAAGVVAAHALGSLLLRPRARRGSLRALHPRAEPGPDDAARGTARRWYVLRFAAAVCLAPRFVSHVSSIENSSSFVSLMLLSLTHPCRVSESRAEHARGARTGGALRLPRCAVRAGGSADHCLVGLRAPLPARCESTPQASRFFERMLPRMRRHWKGHGSSKLCCEEK